MGIDLEAFTDSLTETVPPAELDAALTALWWDGKGAWDRAHESVDSETDAASMRVHAYLHRKEGDLGNAAYWYRQAGYVMPDSGLADERAAILKELLAARNAS